MKVSLTERNGWYDYLVEHGNRRLFGTCSDIEGAQEGIEKAKATLNRTPLNPQEEPMNKEVHSARLISITPDAEKQIVYMARVSNPKNQGNMDTAPRLIKYLLKHKHFSPFEMATMQVEINTTRAIAAQILRHRSFSFQEYSQRYSDISELPPLGLPYLRSQDLKNKQASHDDLPLELIERYNRYIQEIYDGAQDLYHNMLEHGVAKECARSILPLGTPTRIYMSGNIRCWIHYLEVRTGVETQLEHRLVAEAIKEIFKEQLPNVFEAVFGSQ